MTTVGDCLKVAIERLRNTDISSPGFDARLLICHALKCSRADLLNDDKRVLDGQEMCRIEALILRRQAREPVARILGSRGFWGLEFELNEETLEPRPDSETLVEAVLKKAKKNSHILDLGTGSGCLLLSLLNDLPSATGIGVDLSARAVEQASINAHELNLGARCHFRKSDWLKAVSETFDLIVSNPPYIPTKHIENLMPEVRQFDPMRALDGGDDGLGPYIHLVPRLGSFLNADGILAFEVGIGQADAVEKLLRSHRFRDIERHFDLSNIPRCLTALKAAS